MLTINENCVRLKSYAKINLFFDIESKRQDGYHFIKTVMQSIDMNDKIIIQTSLKGITINCNNPTVPLDSRNTCYKAADIMMKQYNIDKGINISINKSIPIEAGLAGGSGNSAAVIIGLNKLWNLNLTVAELNDIGIQVGADVPFCLNGGTILAQGIGEKLTKLNPFKWDNILIIKPEFNMSTAYVYSKILPEYYNMNNSNKILEYIESNNYKSTATSIANTLETAVEAIEPKIKEIKKALKTQGAISAMMTGSGSAVFAFFNDHEALVSAYNKLKPKYNNIYMCKTAEKGCEII